MQANTAQIVTCTWCGAVFSPRRNGGSRQRFCSQTHRQAYHSAARRYVDDMVCGGQLSVADLKASGTACTLATEVNSTNSAPRPPLAAPCHSVGCSGDIGESVANE